MQRKAQVESDIYRMVEVKLLGHADHDEGHGRIYMT